ncbi:RTA1 like protein-domain-containing protein [Dendryphion nanum]|uniref:RTA1 like protein-domain-containing protein n=1 Tax=Dendryphion nanum TaxID=256645 RepID=A0A9P9DB86_9PLEO|nr:RTA1 like protein-domain-containing protein [Dendryphion nanum]
MPTLHISSLLYADLPKRAVGHYTRNLINPYIYDPLIPLAVIGAVIFPLLSAIISYQYIRYRSWFWWAAVIGVAMETIGYLCRLISATDEHNDLPFVIAFCMILLAPSFLAAACYTAFSRVVWFSCPTHALNFKQLWCFPRWITPTFVIFDLFSFAVQLIGAGMISRTYDHDESWDRNLEKAEMKTTAGRVILVLGLILQMSCFASFAVIAVRYFFISRQWRNEDLGDWKMWRKLSLMINIAAGLITLRAIYRTMEIPHDKSSGLQYLQSHEWCFWTFDALPIIITLIVFAAWHPGRYLPQSYTGWKLNKKVAIREKEEIRPPSILAEGEELREYRPEHFGSGVGVRV